MIEADLTLRLGERTLPLRFQSSARRLGVFGPNGVGKSSLLACLAGTRRTPGRLAVDGRELNTPWLPSWRRGLGVVFQDARVFPHLSVRENVAFGGTPSDELLDVLDLVPLLDRRPAGLSGGELRRVALGRALASGSSRLLLDEPFAGVDGARARRIAQYLLAQDVPLVLVTHSTSLIQRLTDEVVLLGMDGVEGVGLLEDLGVEDVETCLRVTVLEDGPTCRVDTGGVELAVAGPASGGAVLIRPADVLVAAGEVGPMSARNVLAGRVTRLHDVGRVHVHIDVGVPIVAELTRGAVVELGLVVGSTVSAIIKATAIRWA
ncbi:MAG: ATP-binding cassette domain-containing protein [Proteobacteria bacterium]|nr:ATP-binding cassette domain-containing protein [Pseudomonadota bacterium]